MFSYSCQLIEASNYAFVFWSACDGLPIGPQLIGRLHSDVQLFQAAYFFEACGVVPTARLPVGWS